MMCLLDFTIDESNQYREKVFYNVQLWVKDIFY